MARYAYQSSNLLKRPRLTPHRVETRHHINNWRDDGPWRDVMRWVGSREARGVYRRDDGFEKTIFYFSDATTAMMFKLKFG